MTVGVLNMTEICPKYDWICPKEDSICPKLDWNCFECDSIFPQIAEFEDYFNF